MMNAIEVDQVSKSYRLGNQLTSLRQAIVSSAKSMVQRKSNEDKQLFWALQNVSYSVAPGEVVGVIGHNGAGKSTMLKLLSRVTYPSTGRIHTRGRMASLIELGAGFHPDLSGRENIFLNGAIMGLKRSEINRQFDSIVAFAGLEKFIDTPVKRYSSGMYVRLAFAVASHVQADLLLVDEVLSVGDLGFQDKSLRKMKDLRDNGATILFISHNMNAVRMFCHRVLLLDHGRLITSGTPAQVIPAFEHLQKMQWQKLAESGAAKTAGALSEEDLNKDFRAPDGLAPFITDVELLDLESRHAEEYSDEEGMRIRWRVTVPGNVFKPLHGARVCRASDDAVCFNAVKRDVERINLHGEAVCEITLPRHSLRAGEYYLELSLYEDVDGTDLTRATSSHIRFNVTGTMTLEGDGVYLPASEWRFTVP
jgi:ABC-type polysaccharide/polyol phosphate transport system ATPase subunit